MPLGKRRLVAVALTVVLTTAAAADAQQNNGQSSLARQNSVEALAAAESLLSTNPAFDCRAFLTDAHLSVGAPFQASVRSAYGATAFPADGADFLVMANGDPDAPAEIADVDVGAGFCTDDQAILTLTFDFGDSGVSALTFRYDFLTYEFPEFVGSVFSDYVQVFLDGSPLLLSPICDASPTAGGCAVALDAQGEMTNVNSPFLRLCSDVGCDAAGEPGWEREFTTVPGDDAGRTGTLTACTPPSCEGADNGIHTLTFIVSDSSDGSFSSAAVFDDLRCVREPLCAKPIVSKCGDGILAPGEDCDDGNLQADDGCSPNCVHETRQCPPTMPCDQLVDFENLLEGTRISEVFSVAGAGPILVSATNPLLVGENAAVIFDSSCPGGCSGSDPDLGTPHLDFGGPGQGAGGSADSETRNDRALGMVGIVAKSLADNDTNGLVDDPNDQGDQEVSWEFDFAALGSVTVTELRLLDIELNEPTPEMAFVAEDGTVIETRLLDNTGDNGTKTVFLSDPPAAARIRIQLYGSAAIDELRFTVDKCMQGCELSCGDADGTGSVTATDAVLVLRYAVGARGACRASVCDTDGNGEVTAGDALGVLRLAVGQFVSGRRCGEE